MGTGKFLQFLGREAEVDVVLHKAGLAMDCGSSFIFLLGWKS